MRRIKASRSIDISVDHHEYWNGIRYSRGLKGTGIPLAAWIMSFADNCDALVNEQRAYKNSWTYEEAAAAILANKAIKFDPLVVDAFL